MNSDKLHNGDTFDATGLTVWLDGFPSVKAMGHIGVWINDRSGKLLVDSSIAFSLAQWLGSEELAIAIVEADIDQ